MENATTKFYAGGFIFDAQTSTVLLHLRDANTKINPNTWAFFGGGSEENETPLNCFLREFQEETGQQLPPESCQPLRSYFNEKLQTTRHVFYSTAPIATKDIRLDEGAGFGWLKLDQLDRHPLSDMTKDDLQFFQNTLA